MRAAAALYRSETQLGSGPRLSVYRYITTGGLARRIHPRKRRAINHVLLGSESDRPIWPERSLFAR